jgi:hypothetical protein
MRLKVFASFFKNKCFLSVLYPICLETEFEPERKVFFFEKRSKKLSVCFGFGFSGYAQPKRTKVFWFFFSKKNCFLRLGELSSIHGDEALFEKKNQKTFGHWGARNWLMIGGGTGRRLWC